MRVAVIGAGSWGSALAWLLGNNGHPVRLWARSSEIACSITEKHCNPRYISSVILPDSVVGTTSLAEALEDAAAVILATPSSAVRSTAKALAPLLAPETPLLLLAKGLEITAPPAAVPVPLAASAGQPTGTPSPAVPVAPPAVPAARVASVAAPAAPPDESASPPAPAGQPLVASPSTAAVPPKLLLDVLAEELAAPERLAVLSGPNHAEEVAQGMLAGTVIASNQAKVALLFQELLATTSFRVYTSEDCRGVQLCGAAKNVIAIAAGVAAGLNLGDNLTALLMTRGLAEISRLVAASGGQAQTCMGLAGMGDLIVTCSSRHSRNRGFGLALAEGKTLEEYQASTHMVVEGALACRALPALAASLGIEMPLSEHVRSVVWDAHPLPEMLESLLERPFKPEF